MKTPKTQKEPISEKVLCFLAEKSLEVLDLSFKIMFDPQEIIRENGMSFYRNPSYIPHAVRSLRRSPYFKKEGERLYVSEKGRKQIIKRAIRNKKRLDGWWLGIIFDIPEASRRDRAFLRRELNMAGCKELQKSVWITPFDIEKELLVLLKLWKKDFRGDIRFLKIKEISGDIKFDGRQF